MNNMTTLKENFTAGGSYQQLVANKDHDQDSYLMVPSKYNDQNYPNKYSNEPSYIYPLIDSYNKNCIDCYDYTGFYS